MTLNTGYPFSPALTQKFINATLGYLGRPSNGARGALAQQLWRTAGYEADVSTSNAALAIRDRTDCSDRSQGGAGWSGPCRG